ncbi:MAG: glycosyltransferase, partial [Janthinobacterium lividum]
MVQRTTLAAVGPLDPLCDGAQDHDLVLRLSEHVPPAAIRHVPEMLYHWRKTAGSTAVDTGNKPYARLAGIRAVSGHLARLGRPASVTSLRDTTFYRVAWHYEDAPEVAIIIPYRDRIAMTRECVSRVLGRTDYARFEVILVDNWSVSPEAAAFAAEMAALPRVRVLRIEEEFNYSRLNNAAVEQTDAPFLVFMNNDLFVEATDWLRVLVNEALADERVGIVGGKFVYPDRTVQHGGVVIGVGGVAGHVHSHLPEHHPGYGARAIVAQQLSAVTAAAMLVRTEAFYAADGFDERDLRVAFNDIDLCLKVGAAGYRIVWTPDFLAEHRESISRGRDDRPDKESRVFHEVQTMIERWGDTLASDPFYNRWLSLHGTPFHTLGEPTGS